MIQPVLQFPDKRLQLISESVPLEENLHNLVQDLWDTLNAFSGCVGLAAPQINIHKRVIVVNAGLAKRKTNHHGPLTLINPSFKSISNNRRIYREGCLSIPDFSANIRRFEHIHVSAMAPNGAHIDMECIGFEAIVIQHEIDHLDGILFLDRVDSIKTDIFRRERRLMDNEPK